MYPVLLEFGPITIYSYGFFLALGYLVATYIFWREGKKQGYQEEKLLDFSIICLVAALVGGRALYVLNNYEQFSDNLRSALYFWEGGFAYYGSVILVVLVGVYFVRRWRWSFLQIADIGALAVLSATVVAKIGSFLAGNDFGGLTSLPWGLTFPYLEGARHPTQLYEAVYAGILFFFLYRLYLKNTKSVSFRSGAVFFYFLFFSSVGRFFFEFVRGDSSYIGPVKAAQVIALVLAGLSLFSLYFYQFRTIASDKEKISKYLFGFRRNRGATNRRLDEPRTF